MRQIPAIAREQCGVFSTRQALATGWTHPALRHATVTGRIHRVRMGAYQVADLASLGAQDSFEQGRWRHAAAALGAILTTPGAFASHSTAAVLRRIPLLFVPARPCLTVLPWYTGDAPHAHLHRCGWIPTTLIGAVGCTSTERTALDLAREHGSAAGVVALDFALHQSQTTLPAIEAELARLSRWPGVRRARRAVELADGRSESVLESRSRLKLAEWGLPEPELQVSLGNDWGRFLARVDFYWDEFGVVGEADGDLKYDGSDPEPLLAEKRRQSALEDLDLEVIRWGSADLRDFESVARRLRRAFARARRHPRSGRRWRVLRAL